MKIKIFIEIFFFIGLVMLPITIYSYFSEATLFYYLVILEGTFILPGLLYRTTSIFKKIKKILKKDIELDKKLKEDPQVVLGDILVIFAFIWLISGILFALPFYFYGMSWTDALFESVSGITTTGLSVIDNPSKYPSDFLLYRSFLNWLGGLGVTGFALTALKGLTGKTFAKIYGVPENTDIFKQLFLVYLMLTIFGWISLVIIGMDWFDALNISFSAISNGGFSHKIMNLTLTQKLTIASLMFLGSISMLIYLNLLKGKLKIGESFIFYIAEIVMFVILLSIFAKIDIVNSVLYVLTTITCGGYGYLNFNLNDVGTYFLILAMLLGGMLVSTSGGIKASRILTLLKYIKEQISRYFTHYGDKLISRVKLNGQTVDDNSLNMVISFVFLFLMSYFALSALLMESGQSLKDSLFVAASALSNVGVTTIDIKTLDSQTKLIITFFMYLGRIEILPIIALFGKIYLSIKR